MRRLWPTVGEEWRVERRGLAYPAMLNMQPGTGHVDPFGECRPGHGPSRGWQGEWQEGRVEIGGDAGRE